MKTIYAICGASAIIWAILFWTGILEPSAFVTGCYAFGWACVCIAETLRW